MDNQNQNQSFLGSLLAPYVQDVQQALPTKQQMVEGYMGAVVAFWVVGGITLFVLYQLTKRK